MPRMPIRPQIRICNTLLRLVTCVFQQVVEYAEAPLEVGPGPAGLQQAGEVGQQALEGGQEGVPVGGEEGVHHVTHLAQDVHVLFVLVLQVLLHSYTGSYKINKMK